MMLNRVVLTDSCFCSPIGNSREQALGSFRSGSSGIRGLSGEFLFTGATIHPESEAPLEDFHPRLSPRFSAALGEFCLKLARMTDGKVIDQLILLCKRPYYSKWKEAESADFDERIFLRRVMQRAGLPIPESQLCLLQASCSSGIIALNLAIRQLRRRAGRILLLGLETELNHERFLALKKLGAVSPERDPRRSCQPFSRARSGLVAGEILVGLLLESRPVEEVSSGDITLHSGFTTADAYRLTDGLETGEFLQACLERTLASVDLDQVDFICPHGTSTPLNDRIEGQVLDRVFAKRSRPITVVPLKQYLGHGLNSSGLSETVFTAEMLRHDFLPALLNLDPLDDYHNLEFLSRSRCLGLTRAIKLSIGFGGLNSCLLLEKA